MNRQRMPHAAVAKVYPRQRVMFVLQGRFTPGAAPARRVRSLSLPRSYRHEERDEGP